MTTAAARIDLRDAVEAFLLDEAALADAHDHEGWLALWEPDGIYWIPLVDDEEPDPKAVSIVFDDHARLSERIRKLAHPFAHSQQPPSMLCRMVGNIRVLADGSPGEPVPGQLVDVTSVVWIDDVRGDRQEIYSARVRHRLRRRAEGWGIVAKTVRLTRRQQALGNITFIV